MNSIFSLFRVVLFLPSIETGGVERNAILVANYLVNSGVPVTVAYTRAVPQVKKRFDERVEMKRLGVKVKIPLLHPRISDAILIFFGFIKLLRNYSLQQPVIVLSFQSNIVSIIASRFVSVPVVVRVSNHPSHVKYESGKVQKIAEWLKKKVYLFADAVITNSELTSNYYQGVLAVPVHTIYNPVDVPAVVEKAKESVNHPWLLNKEKPVVVAVGRLATQKNFPLLLHSFSHVLKKIDAYLIIIGEGGERSRLEEQIEKLGITEHVSMPGYFQNVHAFVAKSDLFVLSSNFEGMPNSLLEAIAAGTSAISTNCLSGPSEILEDGRGGDLVPVGDEYALSESIVYNLINREESLGKHAVAIGKLRDFEYFKIMRKYKNLLNKTVNRIA